MRKIDKTVILSAEYKAWADALAVPHVPEYSANGKYYTDLVMNLFHCQQGLCAFTEQALCIPSHYTPGKWANGRYAAEKPKFNGNCDHFDSTLKAAMGWAWDNLLMIHSDTNRRKWTKPLDPRLKPDHPDFDPFVVFDYSPETHRYTIREDFCPDPDERETLQYQIDEIMDLNFDLVVERRREVMASIAAHEEIGVAVAAREFPTARAFYRRKIT